jgi:hypothetical protein
MTCYYTIRPTVSDNGELTLKTAVLPGCRNSGQLAQKGPAGKKLDTDTDLKPILTTGNADTGSDAVTNTTLLRIHLLTYTDH